MNMINPGHLVRMAVLSGLMLSTPVRADHFSGVNLGYNCLGGGFYLIYLDLYLDCSGVPVVPQTLRFLNSCGTPAFTLNNINPVLTEEVSPVCQQQLNNTSCNGGTLPGFYRHRFERTLYLLPCEEWTISWYNCCRNVLVNVVNEPGTYVEAKLNNISSNCNSSPRFPDTGIPFLCVGVPNSYNPGVTDIDGDFLQFSLVAARYASPDPYPVTYETGHSAPSPIPGMTFDALSGQFSGTPTVQGNYVVVFRVQAYEAGLLVNVVERDVMFVVQICDDSPPVSAGVTNVTPGVTNGPNSVGICDGVPFCMDVVFSDPEPTAILTILSNATAQLPGSTFTVVGTNPAVATLCWTGNEAQMPQNIFIQAFDGACPVENVASRSIVIASCLILPVELTAFTATPEGGGVLLAWNTATERDSKRFVVERSADGRAFQPIGEVPGAGDSNVPRTYSFFDDLPLSGTRFYRLLQEDQDGSAMYSPVVAVEPRVGAGLQAVHTEQGVWVLKGLPNEGVWSINDVLGRTLLLQDLDGSDELPVVLPADSPGGLLLITVRSGGHQQVLRVPQVARPGMRIMAMAPLL